MLWWAWQTSGPLAPKEYLPAVAAAARHASEAVGDYAGNLNNFANRAAFDMFCALGLGLDSKTVTPSLATKETLEFVECTVRAFSQGGVLMVSPFAKYTGLYRQFEADMDRSLAIAQRYTEAAVRELDGGTASPALAASYIGRLRSLGTVPTAELTFALAGILQAGVDTTAYVLGWLLLNLGAHPAAQETLHAELHGVLGGRDLTEADAAQLPFLKACVRESHRYTPPITLGVIKKPAAPVTLAGFEIPAGTLVALNVAAYSKDPRYTDDPDAFRPERFLPAAVAARKGTARAVADHVLLSAPFSAGARMCLGARVAQWEILAIAARLFQDWQFEVLPGQQWSPVQALMVKADPYPAFRLTRRP
eukprot:EG_transcript_6003